MTPISVSVHSCVKCEYCSRMQKGHLSRLIVVCLRGVLACGPQVLVVPGGKAETSTLYHRMAF